MLWLQVVILSFWSTLLPISKLEWWHLVGQGTNMTLKFFLIAAFALKTLMTLPAIVALSTFWISHARHAGCSRSKTITCLQSAWHMPALMHSLQALDCCLNCCTCFVCLVAEFCKRYRVLEPWTSLQTLGCTMEGQVIGGSGGLVAGYAYRSRKDWGRRVFG